MATLGTIKEISTVDGQHIAIIETGSGPAVTATIMQGGGVDFNPLAGDRVLFHYVGREVVVSAIFSEDATSGPGEWLVFSRNSAGVVQATLHLKSDGTVNAGNGADFVAMSIPTKLALDTIQTTCASFVPPGAPDGGAALAAAISGAILGVGTDVASTNLKAD